MAFDTTTPNGALTAIMSYILKQNITDKDEYVVGRLRTIYETSNLNEQELTDIINALTKIEDTQSGKKIKTDWIKKAIEEADENYTKNPKIKAEDFRYNRIQISHLRQHTDTSSDERFNKKSGFKDPVGTVKNAVTDFRTHLFLFDNLDEYQRIAKRNSYPGGGVGKFLGKGTIKRGGEETVVYNHGKGENIYNKIIGVGIAYRGFLEQIDKDPEQFSWNWDFKDLSDFKTGKITITGHVIKLQSPTPGTPKTVSEVKKLYNNNPNIINELKGHMNLWKKQPTLKVVADVDDKQKDIDKIKIEKDGSFTYSTKEKKHLQNIHVIPSKDVVEDEKAEFKLIPIERVVADYDISNNEKIFFAELTDFSKPAPLPEEEKKIVDDKIKLVKDDWEYLINLPTATSGPNWGHGNKEPRVRRIKENLEKFQTSNNDINQIKAKIINASTELLEVWHSGNLVKWRDPHYTDMYNRFFLNDIKELINMIEG